ncbi:MAG: hypothetical protein K2M43_02255 [Mycoplasmoidaceae bacterium]|nr:hypothetical protein [Mycoplasmoidaceae bacterium]
MEISEHSFCDPQEDPDQHEHAFLYDSIYFQSISEKDRSMNKETFSSKFETSFGYR